MPQTQLGRQHNCPNHVNGPERYLNLIQSHHDCDDDNERDGNSISEQSPPTNGRDDDTRCALHA